MNRAEAEDFVIYTFVPAIHKRFEEKFPDTFVQCHTTDPEVYANANGSMYSYYGVIVNSLAEIPETPNKYFRDKSTDEGYNDWSHIVRMYEDFLVAEDFLAWIVQYVPVRIRRG